MLLMQITAAQGPLECCRAVALALARLQHEAKMAQIKLHIIEIVPGPVSGTFRSVLLQLEGSAASSLAQKWEGTIQWICDSPDRPNHKRKNWFIGVAVSEAALTDIAKFDGKITFEAIRARGPGGQHVNKTATAIRATHVSSGINVKVQNERSQHANKKLAELLIMQKLRALEFDGHARERAGWRMQHNQLNRGNPVRVFKGEAFVCVKCPSPTE